MKNDSSFNNEFFYLFANDNELFDKRYIIDSTSKKIYLNKASLISFTVGDEDDSFIDIHSEHSLTHDNGFRTFKNRRL